MLAKTAKKVGQERLWILEEFPIYSATTLSCLLSCHYIVGLIWRNTGTHDLDQSISAKTVCLGSNGLSPSASVIVITMIVIVAKYF